MSLNTKKQYKTVGKLFNAEKKLFTEIANITNQLFYPLRNLSVHTFGTQHAHFFASAFKERLFTKCIARDRLNPIVNIQVEIIIAVHRGGSQQSDEFDEELYGLVGRFLSSFIFLRPVVFPRLHLGWSFTPGKIKGVFLTSLLSSVLVN